jgi:NADH-quinone oxidoreductase subunit N
VIVALAQTASAQIPGPAFAWAEISPELILFGIGILVLLLDTAGAQRLQASFIACGVLVGGAVLATTQSGGRLLVPAGLVALGGLAQFALTALWRERSRLLAATLTALGFAAALGAVAAQWATYAGRLANEAGRPFVGTASLIGNMVAVDGVALFTRVTVCLAGLVTVPLSYAYLQERRIHRGEYYPLLLFAATGMTLLGSSADLIMIFISIEILSLSLYILSGFAKRDLNSQESALKYFLLGAFSSALLLYGIALCYGAAGTTNISRVGAALAAQAPRGLGLIAMSLLLVGFGFKTALVPFHMWTPDVYQGAPTPVTGFMAAATKAAAFAAFLRVFPGAFGALSWSWVPVVYVIAVATMLLGAVLAVVQSDLKRMLGYSAIAHAGYVLIGLVAVSRDGISGSLLYLLIYAFMSLGSFGVLALLERRSHKAMALADVAGLGRRDPVPAALLALFLLALAGIPGTAGFIAKLAVFRAGVEAGQWPLVVVGVISSAIAAFFYIRVIVAMFMAPDAGDVEARPAQARLASTPGMTAGLAASAAVVILLGLPLVSPAVEFARQAATFAS